MRTRTFVDDGIYFSIAQCARSSSHKQYFIYRVSSEVCIGSEGKKTACRAITKIGQFPSLGDILIPNVKRYAQVLEKSKRDEIVRAIGLNAHGIGVGAYVYLRRVFEHLVEEAHKGAATDSSWDEPKFTKASRMDEKIILLRSHLPRFLVENKAMYSLLSKGIHELSEEDCLKHFDPLYTGIELVLDELLVKHERDQKEARAKKALHQAASAPKSAAAKLTSK